MQRRNLRIIGLLFNLTMVPDITLEERRNDATSRYTSSVLPGIQAIVVTNNLWVIIIMSTRIILDTETKYINIHTVFCH